MVREELVRQISNNPESQWFIFKTSELEPKEVERDEKWGWRFFTPRHRYGNVEIEMIKNIRTEGHPSTHRREVRVARLDDNRRIANNDVNTWRWVEDKKRRLSPETTIRITDILKIKVKTKNHCSLSSSLQEKIIESLSNYLFQGRRRPRESFRNRFQSVMFANINVYDNLKEWIIFDKQWLYEEVRRSHLPDCFILHGLCANFQTKNNAELKQWLQQEGYLPVDHNPGQGNTQHSSINNSNDSRSSLSASDYNSPTSSSFSDSEISDYSSNNYTDDHSSSSDNYASSSSSTNETSQTNPSPNSTKTENNPPSREEKPQVNNNTAFPSSGGSAPTSLPSPKENKKKPSTVSLSTPDSKPSLEEQPNNQQTILTNQEDPLTKKKQQTIQEIEAMQNLAALTAYQKNLLKNLEKEKNQQLQQQSNTVDSVRDKGKRVSLVIGAGIALVLVMLLVGYFWWKKKKNRH